MLVQEIPARLELLEVERGCELHVLDSLCSRRLGFRSVAPSGRVQTLPRAKGGAHGRADQQVRLLLAEDLPGLLALGLDVEVPGLAVIWVIGNDIKGQARCEELVLGPPDLSSDSRRRLQLGDDRFRLEVSNAAQQPLREHIVLSRLQRAEA